MEEIFNNQSELQEEQTTEKTTENVVELTDELAENCEIERNAVEDTENEKEKEQKPKVEPLPEQKPFLMSPYERAILDEMERRAKDNPAISEGLKDKSKNIGECFAFITNRAKKMATNNCAMIEDSAVYAWATFYYTQRREIIELELKPAPAPKTTTPAPKTDNKASGKGKDKKEDKKDKPKTDTAKEQKPVSKDKETKVEGANGKVYTITELGLF